MATNNDDKNLSSRSRFGSRNDNTKSIKGNKETEYELMNIDVKKAERDIKQIFKTATDELSKFQKQQEAQTKKLVDNTQKSYQNMFNNITKNYEKSMSNLSAKNASNALGGGSSSSRSSNGSNQKDRLTDKLDSLVEDFKKNSMGSLNDSRFSNELSNRIGDQINKNFENGLKGLSKDIDSRTIRSNKALTDQFSKLTDSQVKGMDKLNKLTPVLKGAEIAFNGITVVLNKWLDRFTSGMNKITSTYEATYTKVSVVTDINQKNYQDWQNETVKVLQEQGLDNNVTITQVMTELSDITSKGITDMQKASDMAMRNTVNQIINPFVDTASDAYTDLQNKFGTKFTDNITGMSQYLADIAGSNRVFKSSIDDVLTTLEPVALASEKELMSGQEYAIVEQLVNSGMMSEREAVSLVSQASKVVSDQYGALTSGNVPQAVAVATGNANNMTDAIMSMLGTAASNGSSITNPIAKGAFNNAFGIGDWANQATDFAEIFSEAEEASNNALSTTLEDSYEKALGQFAGDQNNTAEQLKSNYAENASTWLATFKEAYPDWYSFLETIAKGITTLVSLWVADKAVSGISNLLGGGGSSAGGGILKGIGGKLAGAGNTIGSGLMDVGLAVNPSSSSIAGSMATGAATTLGAAAVIGGGAALGANGISNVVSDFQNGDVNEGTALSGLQGAAGITAAGAGIVAGGSAIAGGAGLAGGIAAAATNPVGWIALAIGGIALLGKVAYDSANSYKAAGENVEKEFNSMKMTLQDEIDQREDYLSEIKDDLDDQDTIEQARSKLIESGLLTEEEINEARTANKDSLEKLTDKYLAETGRLSDDANDLMDKYKDIDKENANNTMKSIKDWYDKNKNVENQTNFDTMYDMVEAVMQDENLSKLSEKDQEFAKKQWSKIQEKDRNGNLKQADLEWFLDRGTNGHLFYDTVEGSDLENFTRRAQNNGASIEKYSDLDASKITEYILPLQNLLSDEDATKDQAEAALKNAKNAGMERSKYSEIQEVMDKFGIESYKTGLDYVPSDDYVANLHEGESILTKDASEVLRSFGSGISKKSGLVSAISRMFNIATDPLKNIVGQGSSDNTEENSSSKEIVDAIYYQTTVLEKAINNINTSNSQQSAIAGAMKNATGMISLKTNYDNNMINLTPVMST